MYCQNCGFKNDKDAIGLKLSDGDNFIIVEFPEGTTVDNADWNNKIKQTDDMHYDGNQMIIDYKDLVFK